MAAVDRCPQTSLLAGCIKMILELDCVVVLLSYCRNSSSSSSSSTLTLPSISSSTLTLPSIGFLFCLYSVVEYLSFFLLRILGIPPHTCMHSRGQ